MLKSYIHISNCHIYVLITVYLAKLQYIYIQLSKCLCRKFQYLYPNAVFRIRFMYKVSMYILFFLLHVTVHEMTRILQTLLFVTKIWFYQTS